MPRTDTANLPVYAIAGSEAFLRGQALRGLVASIESSERGDVQRTRFDGTQAALAEVLDEVRTRSLLGGRRVVVVDPADAFITRHRAALERYCDAPADFGTLVFVCNAFDKRTRLFKAVSRIGRVTPCDPIRGRDVVAWITRHARDAYRKKIHPDAALRLRELAGDGLGELDSELSKLSIYVAGPAGIERADVEALVGDVREENVFALLDALDDGNARVALERWHQVLATDRAAMGRSVAGLAWGVRRLLDARRAWDSGTAVASLAPRMRTDPGTLQRRLRRCDAATLEHRLAGLLAADLAAKTGAETTDVAVEKWIVRHCAARATA